MIGERLLDLRKDFDLSQDELGKILNINKHSISAYEREKNEPPDEIKIRLAEFFNVSVDYLLGITDTPTPNSMKNCIRLPLNFPEEEKKSVQNYINFIMMQYNHKD